MTAGKRTNRGVPRGRASPTRPGAARARAARPEGRRADPLSRNGAPALHHRSRDAGRPDSRDRNGVRVCNALDGIRSAAARANLDDRTGCKPERRRALVLQTSRRRRLHRNLQYAAAGTARELSAPQSRHRLHRRRQVRIPRVPRSRRPDAETFRARHRRRLPSRRPRRRRWRDDPAVAEMRDFNRYFLAHPGLDATILSFGGGTGIGARRR